MRSAVLVLLALLLTACGQGPDTMTKIQGAEPEFTREAYEELTVGDMGTGDGGALYEDIVATYGKPDFESESETNGMKMLSSLWKVDTGTPGANVTLTFVNGQLVNKGLSGLD